MRRSAMVVAVVLAAVLATAGVVVAAGGGLEQGEDKRTAVSPAQLVASGWFCVDVPDNWVHCVPPGVDLEPPDVAESMINLQFYTHDPNDDDAEFLGVETLIRADLWNALPARWSCSGQQREYALVPPEALPPFGYMYCHHFKEPSKLPIG